MVRKNTKAISGLLLIVLLVLSAGTAASAEGDLVVDFAQVFDQTQEPVLESQAQSLSDKYNMDVVIVTINDAGGKTAMAFADDYFDYNGYGRGSDRDGVLMLMDFDNREVWISTSGATIDQLTDARIETLLDAIFDNGMTDGDYIGAATAFLDRLDKILTGNSLSLIEAIISLVASLGLGGLIYGGVRASYKGRAGRPVFAYAKNSLVGFDQATDNLARTFITSRVIPRNTGGPGSGGSSTHTSSSGRSHGGGGRGF